MISKNVFLVVGMKYAFGETAFVIVTPLLPTMNCVEISDYDINVSVLGGIPLSVPLPPPSELSKTVIRIYCEKAKSITVTLYFTAQATGTLLCHGRDCARWDSDECGITKHHVATFMENKNAEQLAASLLEAPVTFIKSFFWDNSHETLASRSDFLLLHTERDLSILAFRLSFSTVQRDQLPGMSSTEYSSSAAYPLGHLQIPGRHGPRVTYERTHIDGKEDPRSSQD